MKTTQRLLIVATSIGVLYIIGLDLTQVFQKRHPPSAKASHAARSSAEISSPSHDDDFFKAVEARMNARRNNLLSGCAKYGFNNESDPSDVTYVKNPWLKRTLFFSDKHKLLLCQIPKCASTNQAKFLATAEGLMTPEQAKSLPSIRATTIAHNKLSMAHATNILAITKRLDSYLSLVIVREPLSRVLSAYRNKMENNSRGDGWARLGWKIHNKFGPDAVMRDVKEWNSSKAAPITLDEFLQYLTTSDGKAFHDPHWNFYTKLCAPCAMKYDFVVHLDTIEDDMKYVMKRMGIGGVEFPPSYDSFTDKKIVKKYFGPADPSLVNALYRTYKKDFEIFGFPAPP